MSDVVDIFGNCEAEKCKRENRTIASESDLVRVELKNYHKGCEPTLEELKARNKAN